MSVVPDKRIKENIQALVKEFKQRTDGRMMNLITIDEYAAYPDAILQAYGIEVVPEHTGKPGRPATPYQFPPPNLTYAQVHKIRKKGRVVKIDCRVVFGTVVAVRAALAMSLVSKAVNTSFVERHNGTDLNRNARKVHKSYCFSKDTQVQESVTYLTMYGLCWPVRTLRVRKSTAQPWQQRTPAMAAGLTDYVWSLAEWIDRTSAQRK